jgi:hypothetical protein
MILLISGTIAQKYIGLYAAQQMFFSGMFLVVLDFVPLPSASFTMGAIFLSLLIKLLKQKWRAKDLGVNIIHIAVLMLLFGSAITAIYSKEYFMLLKEGQSKNILTDYYENELNIRFFHNDKFQEYLISENQLGLASEVKFPEFTIKIHKYAKNAALKQRQKLLDNAANILTRDYEIVALNSKKDPEQDLAMANIEVIYKDPKESKTFLIIADISNEELYTNEFQLSLRRKQTKIDFSINLEEFKHEMHPASWVSKNYTSKISLLSEGDVLRYFITMNKPFRFKQYSFFQSSYQESEEGDISVLAVVENHGRVFPYIAAALFFIGLLVHLTQRLSRINRK